MAFDGIHVVEAFFRVFLGLQLLSGCNDEIEANALSTRLNGSTPVFESSMWYGIADPIVLCPFRILSKANRIFRV